MTVSSMASRALVCGLDLGCDLDRALPPLPASGGTHATCRALLGNPRQKCPESSPSDCYYLQYM